MAVESTNAYAEACSNALPNTKDDNKHFSLIYQETIEKAEKLNLHKNGKDLMFKKFVFSHTFLRFKDKIDFSKPLAYSLDRIRSVIYYERVSNYSIARYEKILEQKRKNGNK